MFPKAGMPGGIQSLTHTQAEASGARSLWHPRQSTVITMIITGTIITPTDTLTRLEDMDTTGARTMIITGTRITIIIEIHTVRDIQMVYQTASQTQAVEIE